MRRKHSSGLVSAVAVDVRYPADARGEVGSAASEQVGALMGEDALLASVAEHSIAGVPLGDLVFRGDGGHLLGFVGRRRIAMRRRRAKPLDRVFSERR